MTITLDHVYALLQDIQAEVQRTRFGFQNVVRGRRTIFVGREQLDQTPWYFWQGGDVQRREPINEDSLVAYVVGVEAFAERQYKGKDLTKLTVYLNTPLGNYRLQSGWNVADPSSTTVASRGLICALACLTPEQLRQPLTIRCSGGTDEPKAVFLNVMAGDKPVFFDRPSREDWPAMQQDFLDTAAANIAAVWGDVAQYRYKREGEEEDSAPSAVKPVPVAAAATPVATRKVAPHTTSPSKMSHQELIKHIGAEQGIEMKSLVDLVQVACHNNNLPPTTKVNDLPTEAFIAVLDEFLILWASTIQVVGLDDLPEPLFVNDEARNKYAFMLKKFEAKTPFQRYTAWNATIQAMLSED